MTPKVLVLGTFDLTHAGHFHLFKCAAEYGELHVGVAHDALVKAFKGKDRPIYPHEQRSWIIGMCRHVARVHIYGNDGDTKSDNDTAQKILLESVKPQFFVEGEDKKGSDLRGYLEKKGIQRISTPRLSPQIKTSFYIEKIKALE